MVFFFRELHFYIQDLKAQKSFFEGLGYDCSDLKNKAFRVQIGRTSMIYHHSKESYIYHYCILVDAKKLEQKRKRLEQLNHRIVPFEGNMKIHNQAWNSDSYYFLDPNGGMPEFIAHHTIDQTVEKEQIAEVALALRNTDSARRKLEKWGLHPYRSTSNRFYDIGHAGSMFILIDPQQKPRWFPYDIPAEFVRLKGSIQMESGQRDFETSDGNLILF